MRSISGERAKRLQKAKRKNITGNIFIGLGLAFLIGAVGLVVYNIWDGRRAAKASAEIVAALDLMMGDDVEDPTGASDLPGEPIIFTGAGEDAVVDATMPTLTVEGYEYIGELEIPELNLKLPVMAEWDYTRLKISPCRFSGSYKTDDLVICAHNYERHFSPVKWIGVGAEVDFISVMGERFRYKVVNRETLQPTSVDEMVQNQNNSRDKDVTNDWDLTLFTCNTGGQTRCAIRCERITGTGAQQKETEE